MSGSVRLQRLRSWIRKNKKKELHAQQDSRELIYVQVFFFNGVKKKKRNYRLMAHFNSAITHVRPDVGHALRENEDFNDKSRHDKRWLIYIVCQHVTAANTPRPRMFLSFGGGVGKRGLQRGGRVLVILA